MGIKAGFQLFVLRRFLSAFENALVYQAATPVPIGQLTPVPPTPQ